MVTLPCILSDATPWTRDLKSSTATGLMMTLVADCVWRGPSCKRFNNLKFAFTFFDYWCFTEDSLGVTNSIEVQTADRPDMSLCIIVPSYYSWLTKWWTDFSEFGPYQNIKLFWKLHYDWIWYQVAPPELRSYTLRHVSLILNEATKSLSPSIINS